MDARDRESASDEVVLDVGDMLCGELALLLRKELQKLTPEQVLRVVARDSAAPEDIPAWCEVTGNPLQRADPPNFWIRRKPT